LHGISGITRFAFAITWELALSEVNKVASELEVNVSDKMIPRLCLLTACIASALKTFRFATVQRSRVGFVLKSSLVIIQIVLGSAIMMLPTVIGQLKRELAISATCFNLASLSISLLAASHLIL
jgi:hypothetical protein